MEIPKWSDEIVQWGGMGECNRPLQSSLPMLGRSRPSAPFAAARSGRALLLKYVHVPQHYCLLPANATRGVRYYKHYRLLQALLDSIFPFQAPCDPGALRHGQSLYLRAQPPAAIRTPNADGRVPVTLMHSCYSRPVPGLWVSHRLQDDRGACGCGGDS